MKIFKSILILCFAFTALSRVSYASDRDVGKHSSTKAEYSESVIMLNNFYFTENVEMTFTASYLTSNAIYFEPAFTSLAIVNSPGILPELYKGFDNDTKYVILKKPTYKSPDLDLRYRWLNEAWYHC